MSKPTTRDITISVAHVEAALALYLKPYFPEVVEIEGVDIIAPLSAPGTVNLKVYFRQKNKTEKETTEELIIDDTPVNDNKAEEPKEKKARKS